MGSLKLVEPFDELPVQLLSMKLIELLPELQPRAQPAGRHMQKYYEDMKNGDAFPPVHVFELADGRMVLSDGHTRFGARVKLAKERRCEWSIRAFVHKGGTMLDALDFAVKANGDEFHRGKRYEDEDRRNAVALYIKRGAGEPGNESWDWSDQEIGRRCGLSPSLVRKIRLDLRESESVPLPAKVWRFRDGIKTQAIVYLRKRHGEIGRTTKGISRTSIGGVREQSAGPEAESVLERRRQEVAMIKAVLSEGYRFRGWLRERSISAVALTSAEFYLRGTRVGHAYVWTFSEATSETVRAAICNGLLALGHLAWVKRAIIVGYRDRSAPAGHAIDLAATIARPVEHMAPEEFAERAFAGEFGETPADATTSENESEDDPSV